MATNSCDTVQSYRQGDGTTTVFSFDFEYDQSRPEEVNVSLYNATTKYYDLQDRSTWSFVNLTTIQFTTPPSAEVDPEGNPIANIKIWRQTYIGDMYANFYPGSAIRAQDLNLNFEQLRFAIEEGRCAIPPGVDGLLEDYWSKDRETLYSTEPWENSDSKIATTKAIQQYVIDNELVGVPEAPVDGRQYARQNAAWSVVIGGQGGLDYLGLIDATQPAPAASDGAFYINTGTGVVDNSWNGIAGEAITGAERLAYDGTVWSILPSEGGGAVSIDGGVAISVDETDPTKPVINLDINKLEYLP